MRTAWLCLAIALAGSGPAVAAADEVVLAVATNFLGTVQVLQQSFEVQTGHRLVTASGSTGQLYAQILNGAPYDILLAADQERPALLAAAGIGEPDSIVTYAVGRLVLWSRQPELIVDADTGTLETLPFRWFAIANPDVAPYGLAAKQYLEASGSWSALQPRLVTGPNIAQAFAMVATGNADLGLVALSQVLAYEDAGPYIEIDPDLYAPVRQDAILLTRSEHASAAREFLQYLQSPSARALVEQSGYRLE